MSEGFDVAIDEAGRRPEKDRNRDRGSALQALDPALQPRPLLLFEVVFSAANNIAQARAFVLSPLPEGVTEVRVLRVLALKG